MGSAELSHTKIRIWMLEKASYLSPVPRGNTCLWAEPALETFAGRTMTGLGCQGNKEAVTPTLQCEDRGVLCWREGWINGHVPAPSPPCQCSTIISSQAPGWVGNVSQAPRQRRWSDSPSQWTLPSVAEDIFPKTSPAEPEGFVNSLCHWGICLISCLSLEALYT